MQGMHQRFSYLMCERKQRLLRDMHENGHVNWTQSSRKQGYGMCFFAFLFSCLFFFFFDSMFVLLVQWVILIVKTELCSCSLVYKWGNIWNRSIFGLGIYPYLWFNSWSLFIFSFPLINWDLASIVLLSFKIDCFKMR